MSRMTEIDEELGQLQRIRDAIKADAMHYQKDLKLRVMKHYGLKWEQVNLVYAEWAVIRDRYLEETGDRP